MEPVVKRRTAVIEREVRLHVRGDDENSAGIDLSNLAVKIGKTARLAQGVTCGDRFTKTFDQAHERIEVFD